MPFVRVSNGGTISFATAAANTYNNTKTFTFKDINGATVSDISKYKNMIFIQFSVSSGTDRMNVIIDGVTTRANTLTPLGYCADTNGYAYGYYCALNNNSVIKVQNTSGTTRVGYAILYQRTKIKTVTHTVNNGILNGGVLSSGYGGFACLYKVE